MSGFTILQDMSLCMECQGCRVACQMQNGLPPEKTYVRFRFKEVGGFPKVTYHVSRMACQHCTDAACVSNCPTRATVKGESGLTHFRPEYCLGCGFCVTACPFDIPKVVDGRAVRCSGCESLVEKGESPVCVQTCVAGALAYGPREEMLRKAATRVEMLKKQYPNAQVYSPDETAGMIWILKDSPELYGLPAHPIIEGVGVRDLKTVVSPTAPVVAAGALMLGGLSWVINRRIENMQDK